MYADCRACIFTAWRYGHLIKQQLFAYNQIKKHMRGTLSDAERKMVVKVMGEGERMNVTSGHWCVLHASICSMSVCASSVPWSVSM